MRLALGIVKLHIFPGREFSLHGEIVALGAGFGVRVGGRDGAEA